jgi:hypothetical protein
MYWPILKGYNCFIIFCNTGKKFHQFNFQLFSSVLLPYCYMNWTLLVQILWRLESQKHLDKLLNQYFLSKNPFFWMFHKQAINPLCCDHLSCFVSLKLKFYHKKHNEALTFKCIETLRLQMCLVALEFVCGNDCEKSFHRNSDYYLVL